MRKRVFEHAIGVELMTEPRRLALRVAAGRALRCRNRFGVGKFAPEVREKRIEPERFHRRKPWIELSRRQRLGLREPAVVHHREEARIAGGVKPRARRHHEDPRKAVRGRRMRHLAPFSDRKAGRANDLVSAHKARAVGGRKPPGAFAVETGQTLAKLVAAEPFVKKRGFASDLVGNCGDGRQPLFERSQIKARSADDKRQAAGVCRFGDRGLGMGAPTAGRRTLRRVEEAVKAVRGARFGGRVGARRKYPEIAIDLLAVGVDDGEGVDLGESLGQNGFAARRRPGENDDGLPGGGPL